MCKIRAMPNLTRNADTCTNLTKGREAKRGEGREAEREGGEGG